MKRIKGGVEGERRREEKRMSDIDASSPKLSHPETGSYLLLSIKSRDPGAQFAPLIVVVFAGP